MARGRQRKGTGGRYNPRAGGYVSLPDTASTESEQQKLPTDKCTDCGKSRLVHDQYPERIKHEFTQVDRETREAQAAQLQRVEDRIKQLPTPTRSRRS